MRYKAFFSYARADDRVANWLHRQLDSYRTPKSLVGASSDFGDVPKKLFPIFRDRTDLEAGGHVAESLQAALEASETLVVLCTPTSAKSHWVNQEVETFLKLDREARIFPVIASGEPDSGTPETECFPPALQGKGLLAADLREIRKPSGQLVGDGREGGRLKLIAGLLGVPLDKLIQRERQRQRRLVVSFAAAALVFAALAVFAGFQTFAANRNAEQARISEANARDTLHRTFATQGWSKIDAGDLMEASRYALAGMRVSPQNAERYAAVLAVAMHRARFGVPPLMNDSEAYSAEFSPDDARIFSVSYDGQAKLWDAHTGRLVLALKGSSGGLHTGQFSADGRYILTAGEDKSVRLWNATDGQLLKTLGDAKDGFRKAEFSGDGRHMLTLANDGGVGVWDTQSGAQLQVVEARAGEALQLFTIGGATDAAISPAGDLVATTGETGAHVRRIADGREIAEIAGEAGAMPASVSFSADGSRLAVTWVNETFGGYATIHDARSGKAIVSLSGVQAICWEAVFSPDGRFVVTMYNDSTARLWSAETGALIAKLGNPAEVGSGALSDAGVSAAFSPDSKRLVTGVYNRTAFLWSTEDGRLLETLAGHSAWIQRVAYSADGRRIVTASTDGAVRVWDGAGDERRLNSFVAGTGNLSADGSRYFSKHEERLEVRSTGDDRVLATLSVPVEGVQIFRMSADYTRALVWPTEGKAAVWQVDTGKSLPELEDSIGFFFDSAFSEDGRLVAGRNTEKDARVWEADTGRVLLSLSDMDLGDLQFTPDNRLLVGTRESDLQVWDLATKRQIVGVTDTLAKYADRLVTPDSSAVLSIDKNGNVGLWSTTDGKRLLNFTPGHGDTRDLTFSANGSRFVTTGPWDATPRVWRTSDGKPELALAGFRMGASTPRFFPDGRRIAVAGDRLVGVWSAIDGRNLAMFKASSGAFRLAQDGKSILVIDYANAEGAEDVTTRFDVSRLTQKPDELARDACLFLLGPQERRFAIATIDADPLLQAEWGESERDVCEGIAGVPSIVETRLAAGLPATPPKPAEVP